MSVELIVKLVCGIELDINHYFDVSYRVVESDWCTHHSLVKSYGYPFCPHCGQSRPQPREVSKNRVDRWPSNALTDQGGIPLDLEQIAELEWFDMMSGGEVKVGDLEFHASSERKLILGLELAQTCHTDPEDAEIGIADFEKHIKRIHADLYRAGFPEAEVKIHFLSEYL